MTLKLKLIDEALDEIDVRVILSIDDFLQQDSGFVFYNDDQIHRYIPSLVLAEQAEQAEDDQPNIRKKSDVFFDCLKDVLNRRRSMGIDLRNKIVLADAVCKDMSSLDAFMKESAAAWKTTDQYERARKLALLYYPIDVTKDSQHQALRTERVYVILDGDDVSSMTMSLPSDAALPIKGYKHLPLAAQIPPLHWSLKHQIEHAMNYAFDYNGIMNSDAVLISQPVPPPVSIDFILSKITRLMDRTELRIFLENENRPLNAFLMTEHAALVSHLATLKHASLTQALPQSRVRALSIHASGFWPSCHRALQKLSDHKDFEKSLTTLHVHRQRLLNDPGDAAPAMLLQHAYNENLLAGKIELSSYIQELQRSFATQRYKQDLKFVEAVEHEWVSVYEDGIEIVPNNAQIDHIQQFQNLFDGFKKSVVNESIIRFNIKKDVKEVRRGMSTHNFNGVLKDPTDPTGNAGEAGNASDEESDAYTGPKDPKDPHTLQSIAPYLPAANKDALSDVFKNVMDLLVEFVPFTMIQLSITDICVQVLSNTALMMPIESKLTKLKARVPMTSMESEGSYEADLMNMLANPNIVQNYALQSAVDQLSVAVKEVYAEFRSDTYKVMWFVVAVMCYQVQKKHTEDHTLLIQKTDVNPMFSGLWEIFGPPMTVETPKGVAAYLLACLKYVIVNNPIRFEAWNEFLESATNNAPQRYIVDSFKALQEQQHVDAMTADWNARLKLIVKNNAKIDHVKHFYLDPLQSVASGSKEVYVQKYIATLLKLPVMVLNQEQKQGLQMHMRSKGCCFQALNDAYRPFGDMYANNLQDLENHRKTLNHPKTFITLDHHNDGEAVKPVKAAAVKAVKAVKAYEQDNAPQYLDMKNLIADTKDLLTKDQIALCVLTPPSSFESECTHVIDYVTQLAGVQKFDFAQFMFKSADVEDLLGIALTIAQLQKLFVFDGDKPLVQIGKMTFKWHACLTRHHTIIQKEDVESFKQWCIGIVLNALCLPGTYQKGNGGANGSVNFSNTQFANVSMRTAYYSGVLTNIQKLLKTKYILREDEISHKIAEYREQQKNEKLNKLDGLDAESRKIVMQVDKFKLVSIDEMIQQTMDANEDALVAHGADDDDDVHNY